LSGWVLETAIKHYEENGLVIGTDGYTALQLGTKHGHKEITQLLLTYGADINGNRENKEKLDVQVPKQ